MIFLLFSILANCTTSIFMRLSQGKVKARTSLLSVNYLTCSIAALCFVEGTPFPGGEGQGLALLMGLFNGMIYLGALALIQYNIRINGVVFSSVFSKIGDLMVPLAASILFFEERPLPLQILGAAIAIGAIIAMNYQPGHKQERFLFPLMLLFILDGMVGTMAKIFRQVGNGDLSSHFLFYTFGMAFLLSAAFSLIRKEKPGFTELFYGILIGIPNYFSSRLLLWALKTVPAVVAYPVRSVLVLVLVALAGVLLFREKLRRVQWYAVGAVLVSVVLLSI